MFATKILGQTLASLMLVLPSSRAGKRKYAFVMQREWLGGAVLCPGGGLCVAPSLSSGGMAMAPRCDCGQVYRFMRFAFRN
jgi:hypothetical protein